jgi:hypothetical protein
MIPWKRAMIAAIRNLTLAASACRVRIIRDAGSALGTRQCRRWISSQVATTASIALLHHFHFPRSPPASRYVFNALVHFMRKLSEKLQAREEQRDVVVTPRRLTRISVPPLLPVYTPQWSEYDNRRSGSRHKRVGKETLVSVQAERDQLRVDLEAAVQQNAAFSSQLDLAYNRLRALIMPSGETSPFF